MKILIVDDDHDVADSLSVLVRVVLDYDVCVRYSGASAIETAGSYRPDVVILEINMPRPDGLQTARVLKADRRLQRTAFVAHTAAADPFLKRVAWRIGFREVIEKDAPKSVSRLIELLAELNRSSNRMTGYRAGTSTAARE